VPSSGHGRTAAAMARNEETMEEHSMLKQQSPGRPKLSHTEPQLHCHFPCQSTTGLSKNTRKQRKQPKYVLDDFQNLTCL